MNGPLRVPAFLLGAALIALPAPARAGLLTPTGVAVRDAANVERVSFSSSEKITLQAKVNNGSASLDFVRFRFSILNPAGAQVFRHTGNAVPGRVGNAASQVAGIPIARFYSGPGIYTFKAEATLDGATVEQQASFTLSSPNIILLYPPNGAQGVSDRPLTFRWSSSGATRYRLTVGDNPSLYNAVFSQETASGENFLAYPDNPSDQRQRLAAGQTYYWKVAGLDQNGNAVAESEVAYSFTVESASLARDLKVSALTMETAAGGQISFTVSLENQGGTSESGMPLKFSLGGIPAAGSPVELPVLNPGDAKQYSFTAALPSDQGKSLAIACIEFFDDNVSNNCMTVQVERPQEEASGGDIFAPKRKLSRDEMLDGICKLLQSREGLSEYSCVDPGIPDDDLGDLLAQLQSGQVEITYEADSSEAPPDYIPPPISAAESDAPPLPEEEAPPLEVPAEPDLPETSLRSGGAGDTGGEAVVSNAAKEWRGLSVPLAPQLLKVVLRSEKEFKRLWRRISTEREPEVDFKRFMVVGVVGGGADKAYMADIKEIRSGAKGLSVQYALKVRKEGEALPGMDVEKDRSAVPYHLMAIPQSGLAVNFSRVETVKETANQPARRVPSKGKGKGKEKKP